MERFAYIGHCTDESRIGIRTVCIDCASGDMAVASMVQLDNVIWMAQSSDGSVLYSTCDDGLVAYSASVDGALAETSCLRLEGLTASRHPASWRFIPARLRFRPRRQHAGRLPEEGRHRAHLRIRGLR